MNITWYGQNCFKITTQKNKNGSVTILIDPFDKAVGLKPPKLEADILLMTQENKKISLNGNLFLISGSGEYDIKEVYIRGISADTKRREGIFGKTTIYTIEAEDMKICHLGKLGQKELTSEQTENIGEVDILMIPVGGEETLEASETVKIMSQIEPKVVIPMYYKVPGLKEKTDGLDKFLKILGIKSLEALPKLSIKSKDLSKEEAKVVVLKP